MVMIKCSCGEPDCQISITVTDEGLFLTSKKGDDSLMYVNEEILGKLVEELSKLKVRRIETSSGRYLDGEKE